MQYVITDGKRYLRRDDNGSYTPITSKVHAYRWDDRSKAENIKKNCLCKNLRNRYHILAVEDREVEPEVEASKTVTEPIEPEPQPSAIDSIMEFVSEKVSGLKEISGSVEERKAKLISELSDVDLEITDINHYIELGCKFNAYQGYLAFKALQERFRRKRVIKDQLYILTALSGDDVDASAERRVQKAIDELNNRKYFPRKLKELFINS